MQPSNIKKLIYGIADGALTMASITQSETDGLWKYSVETRGTADRRVIMTDLGFASDHEAAVELTRAAQKRGVSLNPIVDVPPGPTREQKRARFGAMLATLRDAEHPATAFLRRSFHDLPLMSAVGGQLRAVRAAGDDAVAGMFCSIGGSLGGLVVAMFATHTEIAKLAKTDKDSFQLKVHQIASAHLWLSDEQAIRLFLQASCSTDFEQRIASGQIDYASALRVWEYFCDSGDVCWEITAPKSLETMHRIIVNTAQHQTTAHCQAYRLTEEQARERADIMNDRVADSMEFVKNSATPVYDCNVTIEDIQLLTETPLGKIRWKSFR